MTLAGPFSEPPTIDDVYLTILCTDKSGGIQFVDDFRDRSSLHPDFQGV
jgi:hypothetical protein